MSNYDDVFLDEIATMIQQRFCCSSKDGAWPLLNDQAWQIIGAVAGFNRNRDFLEESKETKAILKMLRRAKKSA